MRFDIVGLLPEVFGGFLQFGVCGRAVQKGLSCVEFWNPRDYATDVHKTTDDRPFGGGSGMILMAEPVSLAIDAAKSHNSGRVLYLAPRGELFTDSIARQIAEEREVILLCGRYRGVDERVLETHVDGYLSVGDYVLSGGETAAMTVMDAVLRHCPGVLGNSDSPEEESFTAGILDAPSYTRPRIWNDKEVPKELLSGDHSEARRWRAEAAESLTRSCRPDLLLRRKK